jgi:hypothetical protein
VNSGAEQDPIAESVVAAIAAILAALQHALQCLVDAKTATKVPV